MSPFLLFLPFLFMSKSQSGGAKQKRSSAGDPGLTVRPVNVPANSSYGMRIHPITKVKKVHQGLDMAAKAGTLIRAAGPGKVIKSQKDPKPGQKKGYGNMVIIDHGNGWTTRYGHMLKAPRVSINQSVQAGTVLGEVGSTGASTGPHLHFEVRKNDEAQDPAKFIPKYEKV